MVMAAITKGQPWALILGGSTGLGLATAKKLGSKGFNIIIIHRDRKSDLEKIKSSFREITLHKAQCVSFNMDATNPERQKSLVQEIRTVLKGDKVGVLVHSIAKGNVKPMYAAGTGELEGQDFQLTIQAMATSLYDWTKLLVKHQVFSKDARIIAFTSEGSTKVWPNYAAVSAAKAAIEAIVRNIALEFAPLGLKANCIQAGVTDTKSLRLIPGSDQLIQETLRRNPNKRLTTPEDVANVVYLLSAPEASWITGTVIKVDGGESLQ